MHRFCPGANGISASCWPFVTTTNTIWSAIQKINQGITQLHGHAPDLVLNSYQCVISSYWSRLYLQ